MRVLVTGGAGFIGSHIVDTFVAAGHDVAVVDNFWEHGGGRRSNLNPKARFFQLDIRDPALADAFDSFKPEVVSHHAAQHSVAISTKDPLYDADVNVKGLINVAQAAARSGVGKIVYASSAATYGTPERIPIDEDHAQRPESPYGITKMAGEHYLRYFAAAGGPAFTALRYGNVFGPRQDPAGEAGVIAIFVSRILKGEPIRIDWDGEQQKDYVYAGDVARANQLALSGADGDVINIGTGIGTSVNELHRLIAQAVGRDVAVEHAPKRAGDIGLCVFANARAKKALGWEPTVSLRDGIARTVDYFKSL
ncbi:MAG: NAD-dependent epimerase/dehydratase family protein [Candidatus Eremiobacteraeota bacterium]|nr:NAD-dependent epimerase/dehydratase family protein [Candidatus Eremiobacteraeota bacterium]MBV8366439.1 NAD-dependent epimerase/dehydratase family protein [Candidatus Eremiobacteraeota bacterium]